MSIVNSNEVDFSLYRSYKTDIRNIDNIFGGQLYFPQTFVLYGVPGVGKTTFLLQVCNAFKEKCNLKPIYITGEQNLAMLSMNCNRIGVNMDICDNTDIDFIESIIPDYDLIMLDSLPTITYNKKLYKYKKSEFPMIVINKMIICAKKYRKCIGIILHSTKSGTYKGGSDIAHMTDAQYFINNYKGELTINVIKNRFGRTGPIKLSMNNKGYDFEDYHIIDNKHIEIPGIGVITLK
jgi:DNA repair protein RadA/Sms